MNITFSNEDFFSLYHSVSTINKNQILDLHSIFWFPSIPVRLIANRGIVKYLYFLWGVKLHLTKSTLRAPRKYIELHRHCWSRHSTSRYSSILFWLSIGDSYWTLSLPFPSHSLSPCLLLTLSSSFRQCHYIQLDPDFPHRTSVATSQHNTQLSSCHAKQYTRNMKARLWTAEKEH